MDEKTKIPSVESYDIDHLGIVAGIMDEICLVEQIDRLLLGTHEQEHMSSWPEARAISTPSTAMEVSFSCRCGR